jgi:hypothetical protein
VRREAARLRDRHSAALRGGWRWLPGDGAGAAEANKQDRNGTQYAFCNYWQVGCSSDTILDYFLTLEDANQLSADDEALREQLLDSR